MNLSGITFKETHYQTSEVTLFGEKVIIYRNMLVNKGEYYEVRILLYSGPHAVLILPSLSTDRCNQVLSCKSIEEVKEKFKNIIIYE